MILKGAVVTVTGASSGIGRELSSQIGAKGGRLILAARRADLLLTEAAEVRRQGGEAETLPVDLSTKEGAERLVSATVEKYGRIDALVNVAGATVFGPYDETDAQDIHLVIATNLEAPMYASRAAIAHFRKQDGGAIVNVSSLAAFSTPPWLTTYAVTKAGMLALSRNLRFELRPFGIRVIGVYPGDVDTDFALTARLTRTTEPMREILKRSRRLFVTRRKVAEVIVDALERDKNGDFFVGTKAKLAGFFIIHAPWLVERASRLEYSKLRHISGKAKSIEAT